MIDLIICTYNRPEKVLELVQDILTCQPAPRKIIIVDSSDEENIKIQDLENIIYVRSSHKNQPYQRFLGYQRAEADYLLYLDDDMEIQHKDFFGKMEELLKNNDYSGIALNFRDKHKNTTLSEVPKSSLFKASKALRNFKNWFTGYPELSAGKLGLCGNRGKQGKEFDETEYVSGGAFIGRRADLFQNFNFQMFDLFEERMGMGEDALIGFGLHKRGKLMFHPEISFLHNDQRDSTYSVDLESLSKRVLYSRLYLSLERQRLKNSSLVQAKIHFQWYAFCRITGYFINFCLKPNSSRKKNLRGAFHGWVATNKFTFAKKLERNPFWLNEIEKNLSKD